MKHSLYLKLKVSSLQAICKFLSFCDKINVKLCDILFHVGIGSIENFLNLIYVYTMQVPN